MDIRKNIIITCVSLFVCATILANQKPYVTNLSRDKYHAANKNWSIGQDEKGIMYFGNSTACWHPTAWNGNSFKHLMPASYVP